MFPNNNPNNKYFINFQRNIVSHINKFKVWCDSFVSDCIFISVCACGRRKFTRQTIAFASQLVLSVNQCKCNGKYFHHKCTDCQCEFHYEM